MIKGDLSYAYSGYNIVAIQKKLMVIALLIKEMQRENTSTTDPEQCINNAILCSRNNDVAHVSEVLNS
jgi:hypothetical protein